MSDNDIVKAPDQLPTAYDYGQDAGKGYEGQDSSELQIPFISLLQALSPQVTGSKGRGVDGARPGLLFNSVTEEVLGSSILFVPACRQHVFMEWKPRNSGGGLVGRRAVDDPGVIAAIRGSKDFGKYKTPEGNDLQETIYLFGVVVPDSQPPYPAVLSFASTELKVYKKWNTTISMFCIPGTKIRPPRWAHLVRIGTKAVSGPKGDFFNFEIKPAAGTVASSLLAPQDERFLAAKAVAAMVEAGQAKAADSQPGTDEEPF